MNITGQWTIYRQSINGGRSGSGQSVSSKGNIRGGGWNIGGCEQKISGQNFSVCDETVNPELRRSIRLNVWDSKGKLHRISDEVHVCDRTWEYD